ncbi:MAG: VWA domain-containing protein [Labedaea sp.]
MTTARYPFSAVVGHEDLRLALLLNAVHPAIGGVLVRGEKGTAKSTVVRGLAALLPAVDVVPGCRFSCAPASPDPQCPDGPHDPADGPGGPAATSRPARLVELPVGATEDRLVGALDLERALTEGVQRYQPGLLCAAHRGVLYVDEVNLLHDHLVDLLLDAAAMGRAYVEREGVSVSHAASFLLVGTMNPEEGELRPQLLDRFGLTVEVRSARDVPSRAEVIRRRLKYEADPSAFAAGWSAADTELAGRIVAARAALPGVALPDAELRRIAALCAAFDVDGMRADLVLARAAVAHAAWRGAPAVTELDVAVAARLALPHRRRRDPFDQPGIDGEQLEQALRDAAGHAEPEPTARPPSAEPEPPQDEPDGPGPGGGAPDPAAGDGNGGTHTQVTAPNPTFQARHLELNGLGAGGPGRRSKARSSFGRTLRGSPAEGSGVHLAGTLAAAAPHQLARGRTGTGLLIRPPDLRRAVREGRESNLVLFAVDASGSMAARRRMAAVTGAVLSLLLDAYQRRDKVGVLTFRAATAELVLPPTSGVDAAVVRLRRLATGGATPLAAGLLLARRTLELERLRDPRRRALLVLVTDGRATVGVRSDPVADALRAGRLLAADGVAAVVVDCEAGPVRLGLPAVIAAAIGGACVRLDELSAQRVSGVVRAVRRVA